MDTKFEISGKDIAKAAGVACLATGVVALSAVVASKAAAKSVAESIKTARNMLRSVLKEEKNSEADIAEAEDIKESAPVDAEEKTTEEKANQHMA